MVWDKINEVAKELKELNYNPLEIRSMMKNAVDCAVNDLIKNEFLLVIFDSPEGANSKRILETAGYRADWCGNIGCRGETSVYLTKDTNLQEFKDKLKKLELIDNYSVITIRENYKNKNI